MTSQNKAWSPERRRMQARLMKKYHREGRLGKYGSNKGNGRAQNRVERAYSKVLPATAVDTGERQEVTAEVARALIAAGYTVDVRYYFTVNTPARSVAPPKTVLTTSVQRHPRTYMSSDTRMKLGEGAALKIEEISAGSTLRFFAEQCTDFITAATSPPSRRLLTQNCCDAYNAKYGTNYNTGDVSAYLSRLVNAGILAAIAE